MPAEQTMPTENEPATVPTTAFPDPFQPGSRPRPDLVVHTRLTDAGAAVCALAGDLDIETLEPARNALHDLVRRRPPLLVVDLGHVDFCDSSGLNLLLQTRMATIAADVGFRLAAPSAMVLRLLELTCADSVFSLHPSVDAALAAPL
ncbi:STAS domain-containing protein [Streptomyces sp. SP17BM10]|uniref:STAS domain-containing protein n=1 Tax=Streptomyces sp. SP17BM10 TaxID=3002530 RepID=UPI002E7A167D|nr:STAS domain-containing protein [Streptomyces sp. SP17BM10]MEE1786586.1 STAS domain-containing protein [Streptomyces sp. SP17BM10]